MLVIAYGTDQPPAAGTTPALAVTVAPGANVPLCINSSAFSAAQRAALALDPDLWEACKAQALAACGTWGGLQRRLITWYFDAIDSVIAGNKDELQTRLGACEGLYRLADWHYSALMPVPRAWLPAADGTFVQVDAAFWRGDKLVALDTGTRTVSPKAKAKIREAATALGAELVPVGATDLAEGRLELLDKIYGGPPAFWRTEVLPTGPFGPDVPLVFAPM
jgi:hypothetical protein